MTSTAQPFRNRTPHGAADAAGAALGQPHPLFVASAGAPRADPAAQVQAVTALESGRIIHLPAFAFSVAPEERMLFGEGAVRVRSKNVSLDPATGELRGLWVKDSSYGQKQRLLCSMMGRFARFTETTTRDLFGDYANGLAQARTSFRPVEAAGRRSPTTGSDDSLLHVDSFSASPVAGRRILRVFSNVCPHGQPRVWRCGEPFEVLARHFLPRVRNPLPGERRLLRWLRVTKGYRTLYDHYMLRMHDTMKADRSYQSSVAQVELTFPSGSTWVCFSDQVSHAVRSGRHALEQTYYLDVDDMVDPSRSPLQILEALLGRRLV